MISFNVKTQVTYSEGSLFCYGLSNWTNLTHKILKTINFNPKIETGSIHAFITKYYIAFVI